MTLKERVIVEVYTGCVMTSGAERTEVYRYMEEIMGRPVFTHELVEPNIIKELQEKSKADFLLLCESRKKPGVSNKLPQRSPEDFNEIASALKTIKDTCEGNGASCIGCPLYGYTNGRCMLVFDIPENWEIDMSKKETFRQLIL